MVIGWTPIENFFQQLSSLMKYLVIRLLPEIWETLYIKQFYLKNETSNNKIHQKVFEELYLKSGAKCKFYVFRKVIESFRVSAGVGKCAVAVAKCASLATFRLSYVMKIQKPGLSS